MTELLSRPAALHARPAVGRVLVDEVAGHLTCVDVADVTHDVRSFTFDLPDRAALRFLPGQYLTLRPTVYGVPTERCYTISSSPTRPERVTITVKRVPGGPVSNWLHDHLRVGDLVEATGPLGSFSLALHPAPRHLFLTAGSGITPAMSMLRSLCDAGGPADVVFVHCARTPADIVFRDELEARAATYGVRVVVVCEDDSSGERWRGLRGRLTAAMLADVAPDLRDREVFTCGPAPFMDGVRRFLGDAGADPARCHEESFVLGAPAPAVSPAAEPPAVGSATSYAVSFARSGRSVTCDTSTTVLEAAARAGIAMSSSCGEGVCGTCKLGLLRGQVDMAHAGGIRPREVAQGKFLPCCSTPREDIEVDA